MSGAAVTFSSSGADAASPMCVPSLVDAAADDLHLQPDDDCAADIAAPLDEVVGDIDGDERPQGPAWVAGADERVE